MSDKTIKLVSIVVPVFNEEGCLQELIDRVLKTMDDFGRQFEFILVDDGSSDSSAKIITKASQARPGVVIGCMLNRNYGQHSAIMAGFSLCRGDLVVTLDADLQNPPEEIPRLIAAADAGADVVGTIRQNRQDTFFRRYASKIVNYFARKATGVNMMDYGCMLRAYRINVVKAMMMCRENSTFIPVLGNSFARETAEIPVKHAERAVGESKYSLIKLINLQFNLLTCMTTVPLRLLTYFGFLSGLCGFLLGVYIIIRRFCTENGEFWSSSGVFTLFALLFIVIGVQMIGIGIIGEYIGRIYTDVRNRPRFFIDRITGRDDVVKNEYYLKDDK